MADWLINTATEPKRKADSSDYPAVDSNFVYVGPDQMVGSGDFVGTVTDDIPLEVRPDIDELVQTGDLFASNKNNLTGNFSFESGTTSWATAGTNVIAASTDYALHGSNSCKATYNDDTTLMTQVTGGYENEAMIAIAYVYIPVDWDGGNAQIVMTGFTGATTDETFASSASYEGQWQRIYTKFTVASDLSGVLEIQTTGAPTGGKFLYVDNVMVKKGTDFAPSVTLLQPSYNDTIRDVITDDVVFSSDGQFLNVTVGGETINAFTARSNIRFFDVLDAPVSMIAVMDEDYFYIGELTLDIASDVAYNSFRMSRFARLPLADCPISSFRVLHNRLSRSVTIQSRDGHHFTVTLDDQLMDFGQLYTAKDWGYVYMDGIFFSGTPVHIDSYLSPEHPGTGNAKTLYVEIRDERGVPMSGVAVSLVPFYDEVETHWSNSDVTDEVTVSPVSAPTSTDTTNAQGVAEFVLTYQTAEAAAAGAVDVEARTSTLKSKVNILTNYSSVS